MTADDIKRLEELKDLRALLEAAYEHVENAQVEISNCVSYASTEIEKLEETLARFEGDMAEQSNEKRDA